MKALMRSMPARTADQFLPSNAQTLSAVAHQIFPSASSAKPTTASGLLRSVEVNARHFCSW